MISQAQFSGIWMVFPEIPNAHALAVLLLTVLALFLFTRETTPLESSSLFILVILITGFELLPVVMAGGLGIVFLWLVAPRLIPARNLPMIDVRVGSWPPEVRHVG